MGGGGRRGRNIGIRQTWVQVLALLLFVRETLGMFYTFIKPQFPGPPRSPLREGLLPQLLEVLTVDGPQLLTPSGTLSWEAMFLFSAFWISSQLQTHQGTLQRPGHLVPNEGIPGA